MSNEPGRRGPNGPRRPAFRLTTPGDRRRPRLPSSDRSYRSPQPILSCLTPPSGGRHESSVRGPAAQSPGRTCAPGQGAVRTWREHRPDPAEHRGRHHLRRIYTDCCDDDTKDVLHSMGYPFVARTSLTVEIEDTPCAFGEINDRLSHAGVDSTAAASSAGPTGSQPGPSRSTTRRGPESFSGCRQSPMCRRPQGTDSRQAGTTDAAVSEIGGITPPLCHPSPDRLFRRAAGGTRGLDRGTP